MSFKCFGLTVEITTTALIGSLILLAAFTGTALALFQLSVIEAVIWAVLAVLLYWVSEYVHQYGHYMAGKRVGYPMTGVRLWWVFGASVYPPDEPTLPAALHIQRALGGAPVSIIVGAVFGLLALLLKGSAGPFVEGLLVFLAVINLGYFGFGAFLPLGFTDGSTLLYYRNKP